MDADANRTERGSSEETCKISDRQAKTGVSLSMESCSVDVFSDTDWAGCKATRKSTSGGVACVGCGVVKSWSKTQGSIALSVGEAEYYALVKGAAEAIGMRSLMADLGVETNVEVYVDSSTAKSIASRTGIGKIRHMDVRYMWVQERVRRGDIRIRKIPGTENPADALTKPTSLEDFKRLVRGLNIAVR